MYDKEVGIYRTGFEGDMTVELLVEFIRKTKALSDSFGCKKIIFDMRKAAFKMNLMDEHKFNSKILEWTGLDHSYNVAIILDFIPEEYPTGMVNYQKEKISKERANVADVIAQNRGQKIWNFFGDYDTGENWLINVQ